MRIEAIQHNSYRELADKAVAAEVEKNWAGAFDFWNQAYAKKPSREATIGMGFAKESLEEFTLAHEFYSEGLKKWPKSIFLLQRFSLVCERMDEWETAAIHWATLGKQQPNNANWVLKLARAQEHLKRYSELLDTLKHGRQRWTDNKRIETYFNNAQFKYSDTLEPTTISRSDLQNKDIPFRDVWQWVLEQDYRIPHDEYTKMLEELCNTWADKIPPRKILAKRYSLQEDFESALESISMLQDMGGLEQDNYLHKAICFVGLGRYEEAKVTLKNYIISEDDENGTSHQLSRFLFRTKNIKAAETVLYKIISELKSSDNPDELKHTSGLEYLLKFHQTLKSAKRPIIENWDVNSEIISSAPSVSGDIFIIFTGFAKQTGAIPLALIDRLLAGYGASVIRLVDHSGQLYQNGIGQLAADFETTIEHLKETIKDLGGKRVYTIGTSGGSFGALRYGTELGAKNISIFSGPTNLKTSFLNGHTDYRARAVIRRLNAQLAPEQLDMCAVLEGQSSRPHIDVYFGAENAGDKAQAENIGHLPNVHLHPIDDFDSHETLGAAFSRGFLKTDIERMLNVPHTDTKEGTKA